LAELGFRRKKDRKRGYMHQGRADLGVYQKESPNLYIEIGTTSFYKLWLNLATKGKFVYLIVPDDDKIIEFTKLQ